MRSIFNVSKCGYLLSYVEFIDFIYIVRIFIWSSNQKPNENNKKGAEKRIKLQWIEIVLSITYANPPMIYANQICIDFFF